MKLVIAYIRSHKLDEASRALRALPITGMTAAAVRGWGQARRESMKTEHASQVSDFDDYSRIEVACSDAIVHQVVSVVEQVAYTGLSGDGKVYVMSIEEAVRISTGERGENIC